METKVDMLIAIPACRYPCGDGNGCSYLDSDGEYINNDTVCLPPDQLYWHAEKKAFLCEDCFRVGPFDSRTQKLEDLLGVKMSAVIDNEISKKFSNSQTRVDVPSGEGRWL